MLESAKESISRVPGIRWLARLRHDRLVANGSPRRFWGAFYSFEEAMEGAASHPYRLPVGYHQPQIAPRGRDFYEQMYLHDYPALFWLAKLAGVRPPGKESGPDRLVDFGGHLGEKYRVFRRLDAPRPNLQWVVLETQAVVDIGHGLAHADTPGHLSFTADRAVLDAAHIVYASGSLQYLECDFGSILDTLEQLPEHLVLNKVPLSEGPDIWTLQANGIVVLPYHVMNREKFIGGLVKRGYRVLDEWKVPEFRVRLPFHDHPGTMANSGLSLTRSLAR